ncbi:hypothetical protein HYX10_02865 [Candidatus Woesearchaeota archaeon]|nr:hypothetical protein [Candidatus Woesearchaeota archaeon]
MKALLTSIPLAAASAASAGAQPDYLSTAVSGFAEVLGIVRSNILAQIAIGLFAFIAAIMLYLRMRSTAANNMRRARNAHGKAVELHESGNEEEALKHYEKANEFREKAQNELA